MGFHAARAERSPQLQRLLAVLREAGARGITSLELQEKSHLVAIATRVSELRHNGYDIQCALERISIDGARIYRYKLIPAEKQGELF